VTTLSNTTARPATALPADKLSGLPAAEQRRTVMHITWSLVAGGAETYALTVASGLDRRRYRAILCGIDQGGALEPEIRRQALPFHIMNRRPGIDLALMRRMYRLLRSERVDVIHTHHFNQLFYSVIAARLLGIRIIHTEHSIEAYKKRRLRWALRFLSLFCDRVTAIGEDGARVLREQVKIHSRKLEIIRAAVDLSRFQHDRAQARLALGLSDADRVAVIVARLYPEKNHALLLAAFAQVVAQLPQAKLLIVGEGTEQAIIETEIRRHGLAEHVRLLGVRRDVPMILAASDLFALTSDREGLPIALLEAMAASLPIVATSVGDVPLVVRHNHNGLLVERRSEPELASAILRLLADDAARVAMGKAGRKLVESDYSLEGMVRRHEALYRP
jgi:glycosyltransferase involved in cell wall biosynthesis